MTAVQEKKVLFARESIKATCSAITRWVYANPRLEEKVRRYANNQDDFGRKKAAAHFSPPNHDQQTKPPSPVPSSPLRQQFPLNRNSFLWYFDLLQIPLKKELGKGGRKSVSDCSPVAKHARGATIRLWGRRAFVGSPPKMVNRPCDRVTKKVCYTSGR